MVSVFRLEDVSSKIKETIEKNKTVPEFKLKLDKVNKRHSSARRSVIQLTKKMDRY